MNTAAGRLGLLCLAAWFFEALAGAAGGQDARGTVPAARVLVNVDGRPITEGDLEFLMMSRRIPAEMRDRVRRQFLEQLIDRRLMQAFLDSRKATASPLELDAEVGRIRELIRKGGDDPEEILGRLGYTEQTLRDELALPLAWRSYTRLLITPETLREYFTKHRRRFDGTEIRASQVFLTVTTPEEQQTGLERLQAIREQIVSGGLSFAEAAAKHSQAPSADAGGDVGWFPFRGKMPADFSRVAFGLKAGEISEPFTTRFGVHLVTVTDEKPGDLSLEDARREVFAALSDELWDEIVKKQRAAAKIEWKVEVDADQPDPATQSGEGGRQKNG